MRRSRDGAPQSLRGCFLHFPGSAGSNGWLLWFAWVSCVSKGSSAEGFALSVVMGAGELTEIEPGGKSLSPLGACPKKGL